jgi:hypothetical protein
MRIHSCGPHEAKAERAMTSSSMPAARPPSVVAALARTTASWSTSVSQGRSVAPFHCDPLAFS